MFPVTYSFILTLAFSSIFAENYFCNFECGNNHTVCARPNCQAGSKCGRNFQILPLSDEDRSIILALHNERRNHVASGKETRYGNGKASNMNVLSYSKELEFVAQCWANNCNYDADECRSTKKFPGHVGQNRRQFYLNSDSNLMDSSFLSDAVYYWYHQITKTNSQLIHSLTSGSGTTYSQLMWARTSRIGCGRVVYGNYSDTPILLIVCNYGPGHLIDEPVYLKGESCSDCSKCNRNYTSLCGTIEDFTKDTWTHPDNDFYESIEDNFKIKNNDSTTQNGEMYLANNIIQLNKKILNFGNDMKEQEKQLAESLSQIERNQQNNEKRLRLLLKQQMRIMQMLSRNNSESEIDYRQSQIFASSKSTPE